MSLCESMESENAMPKLYRVSIELQFPVVAENEEQAREIASRKMPGEVDTNPPLDYEYDVEPVVVKELVGGYEETDLTLDGSMTLRKAWELGNA